MIVLLLVLSNVLTFEVSPALDCGFRATALDFANALLSRFGPLPEVYDALQLQTCNRTRPASGARVLPIDSGKKFAFEVFASPNGSDASGDGSLRNPFRTIGFAVAHVRGLNRARGQTAAVTLLAGTYYLSEPVVLTADDSFLTIQRHANDSVVVSGGEVLSGLQWQSFSSDPNKWYAKLRSRAFTTLFVNGRRAIRARTPDGDPETTGVDDWFGGADSWLPPNTRPAAVEIHVAAPQRNGTLFPTFELGIDGPAANFRPPESYWALKNPSGGGASTYTVPSGLVSQPNQLPPLPYANVSAALVHALQCDFWGSWMFSLRGASTVNSTQIALTFDRGGWQEARGCDGGALYFVDNLFEAWNASNEWYYDEAGGMLFYYANNTDPRQLQFTATRARSLFVLAGAAHALVEHVTIQGLTLTATEPTFMDEFLVMSGGDVSVQRSAAVFAQGSVGLRVLGNVFERVGGNALMLFGFNRDALIRENDFRWTGDNVVVLLGSTEGIDGTNGAQPRRTTIEANLIHELGIFCKQTSGFVQAKSALTTLRANVLFNGPRAGINFNDGFGGGNLVERNLGFNMVRETGDHGVLNSWDRMPFLTDVADAGQASVWPVFTTTRGNYFISNYGSGFPIDRDDGSNGYIDESNVLLYGGSKFFLGYNKHVRTNLILFPEHDKPWAPCAVAMGAEPGYSGWNETWVGNVCFMSKPTGQYGFFDSSCDASHITNVLPLLANNSFFTPGAAFQCSCGASNFTSLAQWQATPDKPDVGSQVYDIGKVTDASIIALMRSMLML